MLTRALAYTALVIGLLWPSALHPVAAVPGAERTDLWDGLWSFWFAAERPFSTRVDGILDHPAGGTLWVADPLNALFAAPLVPLLGLAATWTLLVHLHLLFVALAADRLGRELSPDRPAAGWVAGVAATSSPFLLSQVHNGATEAVGGGWTVLALLALLRLWRAPSWTGGALAGLAMGVATVAHWYAAIGVFLAWGFGLVRGLRARGRGAWVLAGVLAVGLAAPVAIAAQAASTARDNVVGIKNPRELATLRRSIGPADPVGFVAPRPFRSPDFARFGRYQEAYVHCTYLGYAVLVGAILGLRRREDRGVAAWLVVVAGAALVFSMGPVVVRDGGAWILPGRRAVPLPYFLVEGLPGWNGLSLLYRLAWPAVVALAALAGRGFGDRWYLAALPLVEARLVSPAWNLPGHTDLRDAPALVALADAPAGAVMNWPVVGGRAYLYEQTVHHKPVAATLNFANNGASRRVWRAAELALATDDTTFRTKVTHTAQDAGVRYLVLHDDPSAEADDHDAWAKRIEAVYGSSGEGIRVVRLW